MTDYVENIAVDEYDVYNGVCTWQYVEGKYLLGSSIGIISTGNFVYIDGRDVYKDPNKKAYYGYIKDYEMNSSNHYTKLHITNTKMPLIYGDVYSDTVKDSDIEVFKDKTFTASQWKTYSIASLIPDDGYDYEVVFEGLVKTGTSSGNAASIWLYAGTASSSNNSSQISGRIARCVTRTSSAQQTAGTVTLPIKANDKNVTVSNADSSGTSGNCGLWIKSYRRLGTNKGNSNTDYFSKVYTDCIEEIDYTLYCWDLVSSTKTGLPQNLYSRKQELPALIKTEEGNYAEDNLLYNADDIVWMNGLLLLLFVAQIGQTIFEINQSGNLVLYESGTIIATYQYTPSGNITTRKQGQHEITLPIGSKSLQGQWVSSSSDLASGISCAKNAIKTYDLSSYLPNDGYDYEVLVSVCGRTGTSSGNTAGLRISNDSECSYNIQVTAAITRASNFMYYGGNAKIRIDSTRKLYLKNTGSATATNITVHVSAYRKTTTNAHAQTPSVCIKTNENVPSELIYGSPTITNGVVSDFSESNYLEIPDGKQNNNAEYVVKFTTGDTTSSKNQAILHAEKFLSLEIAANSWNVFAYNWSYGNEQLFTASANTTYWVKILVESNNRKTYSYSTDGETYTQVNRFIDGDIDITANYRMKLGNYRKGDLPFLGTIDLNACYINVDGVRFWNGIDNKKYMPVGGDYADTQWTRKINTVYSSANLTSGVHDYTVNNYLPEDDTPYQILVSSTGRTGTSSGNACHIWLNNATDVIGNPILAYCNTRTASSMCDQKSGIIICTQRNGSITLPINVTNSGTTGNCGLQLMAYKRIGDNT